MLAAREPAGPGPSCHRDSAGRNVPVTVHWHGAVLAPSRRADDRHVPVALRRLPRRVQRAVAASVGPPRRAAAAPRLRQRSMRPRRAAVTQRAPRRLDLQLRVFGALRLAAQARPSAWTRANLKAAGPGVIVGGPRQPGPWPSAGSCRGRGLPLAVIMISESGLPLFAPGPSPARRGIFPFSHPSQTRTPALGHRGTQA